MTALRPFFILALTLGIALAATSLADADDDDALEFAVFDLSDIVAQQAPHRAPRLGLPNPWGLYAPARRMNPPKSVHACVTAEQISELIYATVEPASWESVQGARLRVEDGRLLVRAKGDVVEKVRAAIAALRTHAARRVLLTVDVQTGSSEAYPHMSSDSTRSDSGSLELPPFTERTIDVTNQMRYVGEYEVEIAQGSIIANPIVFDALGGLVAELAASPTMDGDHVLVEGVIQQGRFNYQNLRTVELGVDEEYLAREFRSGSQRFTHGALELPVFDETTIVMSALVPSGGRVDIPVVRGRTQTTIRIEAAVRGEAGFEWLWPVGAITRPGLGAYVAISDVPGPDVQTQGGGLESKYTPTLHFTDQHGRGLVGNIEQLTDMTRSAAMSEDLEGRILDVAGSDRLFVRMPDGERDRVLAFLRAREAQAIRQVVVDVRAYSVLLADFPTGPGAEVPDKNRLLLAAGRVPVLSGRRGSLIAGNTANYLADYDVEVAQEARIADPIVLQAFDGLAFNVRPLAMEGSRMTVLEVQLILASSTLLPEDYKASQQYLGSIDRVLTNQTTVDTTIRVPNGGTYVLDGGTDPNDPRKRLAIELRVDAP